MWEQLHRKHPGLTLTLDYTHFTRIGLADTEVEPLVQYASHFHARRRLKLCLYLCIRCELVEAGDGID